MNPDADKAGARRAVVGGGGDVKAPAPGEPAYVFDNAAEREAEARFAALPALYDPGTIRHLEALGVGPGWRCLEVGAGAGSVARWLADRVGPAGHVLATDVDPRFLASLAGPALEVRRHDITTDPLPDGEFDLAHARLVLGHLPARDAALDRMIAALRPGGWLLLEDFDSLSMPPDPAVNPAERRLRLYEAMKRAMTERGVDLRLGRLLPGRLRARGLADVGAEGRVLLWQGAGAGAALLRANFAQLRAPIAAAAGLTAAEFDRELAQLDDPDMLLPAPVMWAVWGRRP